MKLALAQTLANYFQESFADSNALLWTSLLFGFRSSKTPGHSETKVSRYSFEKVNTLGNLSYATT